MVRINYLLQKLNIDPNKGRRLFRYTVTSGISFFANLGLTALFHEVFGFSEQLSFGMALVIVFANNFIMLRYWIFPENRHMSSGKKQLANVLLSSILFRLIEYGMFNLLFNTINMNYLLVIALVTGFSFIAKFVLYNNVIFSKPSDSIYKHQEN